MRVKKVIYMDDLDSEVEADAGTISFSLEGTSYEVDLSKKNATKLRAVLGPFIAVARTSKVAAKPASKNGSSPSPLASGYSSDQLTAIREWANKNGHTVSERGRVPKAVIEEFEKAGGITKIKSLVNA